MRSSAASKASPRFTTLDARKAARFAKIALGHVAREYPNKLDHVLAGPADLKGPRELHPVFFGSFDWHSCVHSYWLLATLYRLYPQIRSARAIRARFTQAFTNENIAAECAYLRRPSAHGFERPYGWAWLLMLQAELLRHDSVDARRWSSSLQPLSEIVVARFRAYLPKATYPNRAGVHANSAFALTLAQEYAQAASHKPFAALIRRTTRAWYSNDAGCQAWEPSGEDFLSPALIEAACMRAILAPREFHSWLKCFLPRLPGREPAALFAPVSVSDRTDGRIVHLDGLNLSRAWCWRSIASALPPDDPLHKAALRTAQRHLAASHPFIAGHYMGEHWLASFALLALRPPPN